jgi:hypothetical protein
MPAPRRFAIPWRRVLNYEADDLLDRVDEDDVLIGGIQKQAISFQEVGEGHYSSCGSSSGSRAK